MSSEEDRCTSVSVPDWRVVATIDLQLVICNFHPCSAGLWPAVARASHPSPARWLAFSSHAVHCWRHPEGPLGPQHDSFRGALVTKTARPPEITNYSITRLLNSLVPYHARAAGLAVAKLLPDGELISGLQGASEQFRHRGLGVIGNAGTEHDRLNAAVRP